MNAIERGLRRLKLLTLPPAEATTVTWDFVNNQDVVIPQRCSGDPSHEEIAAERKIPGKRSKSEGGSTASSWLTEIILFALFGWIGLLFASHDKKETIKLAFDHSMPYCTECYSGVRRTLTVRNILIGIAVLCLLSLCAGLIFEWGSALLIIGAASVVGIVFSNMIKNRSDTIRILDFNPLGNATQVTLRFANPDYVELFVLENNIVALNDPRSKARIAAANLLGSMGDYRATLPLVNALNDAVAEVREAATKSLLQLNDPKAKEALLDCLKNPNLKTRLAAIDILQPQMNDEETAVSLITILQSDEASEVRLAAAEALPTAGEMAVEPLIDALADAAAPVRVQAATALGSLAANQAIPALIKALTDPAPDVRQEAARVLGILPDPTAIDPLLQLLHDRAEGIAPMAVNSLLTLAPDQPLSQALHTLVNGEVNDRSIAAQTLARLGDQRAVPALRRSLYDDSAEVRQETAAALILFGADEALEPLLEALTNQESSIRTLAAAALGKMADPRAEDPLLQAVQDTNAEVRQNAAVALLSACSPAFYPVAETIKIMVTGQVPERQAAAQQLAAHGNGRVKPLLIWTLLHDEAVDIRTEVAKILPKFGADSIALLIQALNTPDSDRAAETLVTLGAAAVEALVATVRQSKGITQRKAIRTLGQIEDGRVEDILVEVLQDGSAEAAVKSEAFSTLSKIADKSQLIPVIGQMIEDKTFNVGLQKTAVRQLGRSNNSLAVAPLVNALDNWSLREPARDGLQQLGDLATDALLVRYENEKDKELRRIIGDLLGDKKPAGFVGRMFGRKKN